MRYIEVADRGCKLFLGTKCRQPRGYPVQYTPDSTLWPYSQQPDLELMVQINFMIDVPFVMSHVHESVRDGLKTIVYHGLRLSMNEVMVRIYADADWLFVFILITQNKH